MKAPKGMSKTMTHRFIIADRSKSGIEAIDDILEQFPGFPELNDRAAIWRASTDRFFTFVVSTYNRGSIGATRAKDLKHLLKSIDERFDTHLLPPVNPAFDIVVEGPDQHTIYDRTKKLLLATVAVLEPGVRPWLPSLAPVPCR